MRRSSGDSFEVVFLALPIGPRVVRHRRRERDLVEVEKALPVLRLEESLRPLLQSLLESVRVVRRLKIEIVGQQVWIETRRWLDVHLLPAGWDLVLQAKPQSSQETMGGEGD